MKEVKIEKTSYDIKWEAIDGTQFSSEEECKKYEQSAVMVLWARFLKLVVAKECEYSFFKVGCEDNSVYAIKMEAPEDVNTVMQLYLLDNPWLTTCENGEKYKNEAFEAINKAYKDKDILFVGENCEEGIFIIGTRNDMVKNLINIDKEYKKDA